MGYVLSQCVLYTLLDRHTIYQNGLVLDSIPTRTLHYPTLLQINKYMVLYTLLLYTYYTTLH